VGKVKPIALVSSKDDKRWHEERGRGVTKTDVTRLISGTLAAKRAVYADKHGEKSFHGNQHTARGHEFEPAIAEWVEAEYGIPASGVLYAHGEKTAYRATPDTFLWDDGEGAFVEIKTTTSDWSAGLPRKIIDDVLWQRFVLGAGYSAVAWQQFDKDGMPLTLEPALVEVPDDPDRTAQLVAAADAYLEWAAAGCPDEDSDVPPQIRDAAEEIAAAKARIAELDPIVKGWALAQPDADTAGVKRTLAGAVIALTVTRGKEFDEAAARAAHPEAMGRIDEALTNLADIKEQFMREKVGQRWSVSAPKGKEAA